MKTDSLIYRNQTRRVSAFDDSINIPVADQQGSYTMERIVFGNMDMHDRMALWHQYLAERRDSATTRIWV